MSTLYHNLVAVAAEAQKKSAEQASGPEAHSPPRKLIRSSSSPALSPARVPAGNGDDDSVFHEAPETKVGTSNGHYRVTGKHASASLFATPCPPDFQC
eukprot:6336449-Pyramimonas_sp.AAC.1